MSEKRYLCLQADSVDDLEQLVSGAMNDGWWVLGGVAVTTFVHDDGRGLSETVFRFYQSMVRS